MCSRSVCSDRLARPSLRRVLKALAAAALAAAAPLQAAPAAPPQPSGIEEKVTVHVLQFRMIATDKDGLPVTDLSAKDLAVYEGRTAQRLAFVERVLGQRHDTQLLAEAPAPKPFVGEARETELSRTAVPAPPPVRRIVLALDLRDSRSPIRERWREAAHSWIEHKMREDDRVSVVLFRDFADWLVSGSSSKVEVAAGVDAAMAATDAPDRDRRKELDKFMQNLESICSRDRKGRYEANCGYTMCQDLISQWQAESRETIEAYRGMIGQLAAVPGSKLVILFTEGLVADAGAAVFAARQGVVGDNLTNASDAWSMSGNVLTEMSQLQREARSAGVSFQVIDSHLERAANAADNSFESPAGGSQRWVMGADPWTEVERGARDAMHSLAAETGGRYYSGQQAVASNVAAAAGALEGLYLVGYYRSPTGDRPGALKVKISRPGVTATYQKLGEFADALPLLRPKFRVEVGRPVPVADGRLDVPLAVIMPLSDLPLRSSGDVHGCVLGVFAQAQRPDGSVAGESFEIATLTTQRPVDEWTKVPMKHVAHLTVPEGSYRVRVRLSDDRLRIVGDNVFDVGLSPGAARPGLGPPPEKPSPEPAAMTPAK